MHSHKNCLRKDVMGRRQSAGCCRYFRSVRVHALSSFIRSTMSEINFRSFVGRPAFAVLLTIRPFVRPTIRLFVRTLVRPYIRPSVCPSVPLSVRPFVGPLCSQSVCWPSISQSADCLSILKSCGQFARLSVRNSVLPFARLSIRPSARPVVCPSVSSE